MNIIDYLLFAGLLTATRFALSKITLGGIRTPLHGAGEGSGTKRSATDARFMAGKCSRDRIVAAARLRSFTPNFSSPKRF